MNTNTERKESAYVLKSELAKFCLPEASRDAERKFGWMNSVCALFLLIGIFGRPFTVSIRQASAPAEILPTLLEPVAMPPPATTMQESAAPDDVQPDRPDFAPVVIVASNIPVADLSIPAIGNLVIPTAMAMAPSLQPLAVAAPKAPVRVEAPAPVVLNNTGIGGARPYPPYPPAALERRQQGTVVLTMDVDPLGEITSIDIKASSGYAILDHSTLEFVQRNWKVPPGAGSRTFEAAVKYVLESE